MKKEALDLDRALAAAQARKDQKEVDRIRDLIFIRQRKLGFIDMDEQAGPEESPKPGTGE